MKKLFLLIVLVGFWSSMGHAQQDAQYTQWQWNKLLLNPAYAGSKEVLNFTLLGRNQWVDMDGAPKTATFGIHAPFATKRVNLGLSGYYDELGIERKMGLNLDYAYGIPMDLGTLQMGIRGGFESYSAEFSKLLLGNASDPTMSMDIENNFNPNFGFGIHYYNDKFWIGGSVPHVLNSDLTVDETVQSIATQDRHYFFNTGYIFDLSNNVKLRPSTLMKFADGSPMQWDINLSAKFYDKLWLGIGHRTGDSYDFNIEYLISNQLSIGYAYDLTNTELSNYNSGTHEIMLGFDFAFEGKKIVTPRNIQKDF